MKKKLILILLLFLGFVFADTLTVKSNFLSEFNKIFVEDEKVDSENTIFGKYEFELIETMKDHSKSVYSVSFSNDGKYFASSSSDKTIKIYNTSTWKLIKTLSNNEYAIKSISFSVDNKYLAAGSNGNEIIIYDTKNWDVIKILKNHKYAVTSVLFSSNGQYFASGSFDNTVQIYDANNWELIKTLNKHSNLVYSVSFSPNCKYFASGSFDNTVQIYNTDNWELIKTLSDYSSYVLSVSFSPDGKHLATGSSDRVVQIYNTDNWELIKTLSDHEYAVKSVLFSPDGKYLVTGSNGNAIIIYSTKDWELFKTIADDYNYIFTSISFSPNGEYLATGGDDATVKIYKFCIISPDMFIKKYVENHINEWQEKGEFEKTVEYRERMNNRDEEAKYFFNEAKRIYEKKAKIYWNTKKEIFVSPILNGTIQMLGNYNADRETFKLNISTIGDIVLNVPIDYAESFKRYKDSLKLKNPKVVTKDDNLALSSIEIFNPIDVKSFVYDINVKKDYNTLAETSFEFKPYNYNFEKVEIETPFAENKPKNENKQEDKYGIYKDIPKNPNKNSDAIAVIIGNKDYKYLNDVDYAIKDVRLVKKYLMESFGYEEQNIIWLENASKGEFESVFGIKGNYKGRLNDFVKKNKSDVFIYYSGHGAPNVDTKKGYFVPIDCNPATVALNGYPIDLLYENLSKIKYKKLTVVIDACFSGENTLKDVSPINIIVDNPLLPKNNSYIYTSAKANQLSTWYPSKGHSLFTYYFLKGIQEKGIEITHQELIDYLNKEVPYMSRRLNAREQNPTFNGDRNKYLAK